MRTSIKDWPLSERPRELLWEKGPEVLSDAGLLAILLRTGVEGEDAVSLGRNLLRRFGGLRGLLRAGRDELLQIKGLGPAKIAQILAAIEISKRHLKEEILGKPIIHGPEDVIEYLSVSMSGLKEEVFKVLYLDKGNAILTVEDLSRGTIDQAVVHPRNVIKRAFELNASALIFVHNHPSGALTPSDHDKILTAKLVEACKAVDLVPLDHIIIGPSGLLSLKEIGLFG